jgi:hypothetical protein
MGYFNYLFLVIICGGCGGLVYSLTTRNCHDLQIPFFRKMPITLGCLGHMFIGSCAGFLLVVLFVEVDLDISKAVPDAVGAFTPTTPLGREGVLVAMKTIGIALVGGFLGLKLITKLADETGQRLGNLEEKVQEQEIEADIYRHALFARGLRGEKDIVAATREIEKSLAIRPTKFGEFVNALIMRSKKDYQGAIGALDRALKLPSDTFVKDDSNVLWNKACYLALSDPTRNLSEIINNLDLSIKISPSYRDDIKGESDLKGVLDSPIFKEHYNS